MISTLGYKYLMPNTFTNSIDLITNDENVLFDQAMHPTSSVSNATMDINEESKFTKNT